MTTVVAYGRLSTERKGREADDRAAHRATRTFARHQGWQLDADPSTPTTATVRHALIARRWIDCATQSPAAALTLCLSPAPTNSRDAMPIRLAPGGIRAR